jgi:hypothetical protein
MGAVWDAPPFLVLSPTVSGRRPLPIHDRILIRFFRNMPVFSVFFLLPNVTPHQTLTAASARLSAVWCRGLFGEVLSHYYFLSKL